MYLSYHSSNEAPFPQAFGHVNLPVNCLIQYAPVLLELIDGNFMFMAVGLGKDYAGASSYEQGPFEDQF